MDHYFKDRADAANQLIPHLKKYAQEQGVVLAIPRGGVSVAFPIARHYHFLLDLLMTKKIGHPSNPEYAIGAVGLESFILDEDMDASHAHVKRQVELLRESLKERYKKFRGGEKPLTVQGKTAIIVDDGIATGYTILSAIEMLKQQSPEQIVVAVPVASAETLDRIKQQVDDLICLYTPVPFVGVGRHYKNFEQVSDEEVHCLLKEMDFLEERKQAGS